MKYICLNCGYSFKGGKDRAWYECIKCGGDCWWEGSGYFNSLGVSMKCDQINAIYEDEHGNQIPVNKKGNIVNNNYYDRDSRGWKRDGRKIAKYDERGKKLKEGYK